jgi:hypothetical protein
MFGLMTFLATLGVAAFVLFGGVFVLAPVAFALMLTVGALAFGLWLVWLVLRVAFWLVLGVGGALVAVVALPLVLLGGAAILVASLAPVWLPLLAIALVVWFANRRGAPRQLPAG